MSSIGTHVRSVGRGLPLAGLSVVESFFFCFFMTAISLVGAGVGIFLVPPAAVALRGTVNVTRRLSEQWSGITVEEPYRPEPDRESGFKGWWQRTEWVISDVATWRDLGWTLVNSMGGVFLTLLPLTLVAYGIFGLLMPQFWDAITADGGINWYWWVQVDDTGDALMAAALGVPTLIAGVGLAPWLLRTHASMAQAMLGPTETTRRMQHLAETRSDAVNTSAAELRRIERDLHDGAQARLVALGMNLGVAEQLLKTDPDAVATILADTRKASASALKELRDLIRGIHPPVLADRGLADAVRALALDSPLDVTVKAELPGRPDAPVESAMYFALSEALTNCAKHACAQHVSVDVWHDNGRVRAQVSDDGQGGADPSRGTGLRGIERRLATFDGLLAVTSPVGGPTTLTMEVPCVLS